MKILILEGLHGDNKGKKMQWRLKRTDLKIGDTVVLDCHDWKIIKVIREKNIFNEMCKTEYAKMIKKLMNDSLIKKITKEVKKVRPYFETKVVKVKRNRKEYDQKHYLKNRENIIERVRRYQKNNRKNYLDYNKKYYQEMKEDVLNTLSGGNPHCIKCGCNDIRLLEINHKNGGGNQECRKGEKIINIYWEIYKGRRNIDDLEILCRVCNARHYLELKYGELPYKIIYNKGGE